jgi:hypothetical protein
MIKRGLINNRGRLLHQIVVHIILVGLLFAVFLMATADKINARGVKQQVIEKQVALLIDSAVPGMSFEIEKFNLNGRISELKVKDGRVYVNVAGLNSLKGYPYFSPYKVFVDEEDTKFVVRVE